MSVQWYVFVFGYTLALGKDVGGVIGNLDNFFYMDVPHLTPASAAPTIPGVVWATFQIMFAVITPLLITGAFSERVKFGKYLAFIVLWSTVVYYPLCHWVWGGGFLAEYGVIDFAGGIVIHVPAGVSSLVVAIVLGPRTGFDPDSTSWDTEAPPHSIALAVIGASMLWLGWFGFNAGSALAAGVTAASMIITTHIAASVAGTIWISMSWVEDGKPSLVATINGCVAGLAGITPASGFVSSQMDFLGGLIIGFGSYYAVKLFKGKLKIDDALDVSSVHGVTGLIGSLWIGVAADTKLGSYNTLDGLFYGGGANLLGIQIVGVLVAGVWAAIWTFVICKLLGGKEGMRRTRSATARPPAYRHVAERSGKLAAQYGRHARPRLLGQLPGRCGGWHARHRAGRDGRALSVSKRPRCPQGGRKQNEGAPTTSYANRCSSCGFALIPRCPRVALSRHCTGMRGYA